MIPDEGTPVPMTLHERIESVRNTGHEVPINPGWKTFANILYASKIYE